MSLAPIERALRFYLIDQARQSQTVTYSEVAEALRPYSPVRLERPFSPLYSWLDSVSGFEVTAGRPMLSSIVVNQATQEPGDGFYDCARRNRVAGAPGPFQVPDPKFWEEQRDAVFNAWSRRRPLGEPQLQKIKLADGREVRVREYADGSVRILIDDPPYVLSEAFLTRGKAHRAILRFEPRWNWHHEEDGNGRPNEASDASSLPSWIDPTLPGWQDFRYGADEAGRVHILKPALTGETLCGARLLTTNFEKGLPCARCQRLAHDIRKEKPARS